MRVNGETALKSSAHLFSSPWCGFANSINHEYLLKGSLQPEVIDNFLEQKIGPSRPRAPEISPYAYRSRLPEPSRTDVPA